MPARARGPGSERPLTARSVIATTLLGTDAPRLRAGSLVRTGALFGIGEGAMRTALWRMAADGELAAGDGWYALAGGLLDRRSRVEAGQAAPRRPWDGTWELVVLTAERRSAADRLALRSAAVALHLAEVREGVWARPDNLAADRLPAQRAVVEDQCLRFTGAAAPECLAGDLFDLDGWAAQADDLLSSLTTDVAEAGDPEPDPDDEAVALAAGFMLGVAVVRHLQADPLLPDELLPARWPGDALRRAYVSHHRAYQRRFTAWLVADG